MLAFEMEPLLPHELVADPFVEETTAWYCSYPDDSKSYEVKFVYYLDGNSNQLNSRLK